MQYGFIIPRGEVYEIVDLAVAAEDAGWDAVFYWDGICIDPAIVGPTFDPWATLAAIAVKTSRVRIGAMLTPPSRRRPWKLARETVTVDHLSHGRLILPVGLGALDDGGFTKVGEVTDRKGRAELLDESLAILTGLWTGRPFHFDGQHYHLEEMTFLPPPVQSPRIPIWVAGLWGAEKSMARALRYDGLLPNKRGPDGAGADVTPADIAEMARYIQQHRTPTTPFDLVSEGQTPGASPAQAAAIVRPFAEAGATWWMESMWTAPNMPADTRARILQGPPRVDA